MVEMFVCLCLASQKTSEREIFVPARTNLGVKHKVVPDTFSGCYKQRIVAPDLFPLKSSEKIPVLKDGAVPEMQMCHPQDPQNRDY